MTADVFLLAAFSAAVFVGSLSAFGTVHGQSFFSLKAFFKRGADEQKLPKLYPPRAPEGLISPRQRFCFTEY